MKATGIVRRIDDLGRVVIPKEIRRTMRIREGDPLEIFTNNDGEVIFKKYSLLGELGKFAGAYAEVLGKVLTTPVLICDRDHVIAAAGLPKKEVLERRAAPALEEIMESRQSYILENPQSSPVYAVEGYNRPAAAVYPILAAGDVCGAVILSAGEDDPGGVTRYFREGLDLTGDGTADDRILITSYGYETKDPSTHAEITLATGEVLTLRCYDRPSFSSAFPLRLSANGRQALVLALADSTSNYGCTQYRVLTRSKNCSSSRKGLLSVNCRRQAL